MNGNLRVFSWSNNNFWLKCQNDWFNSLSDSRLKVILRSFVFGDGLGSWPCLEGPGAEICRLVGANLVTPKLGWTGIEMRRLGGGAGPWCVLGPS